MPLTLDFTPLPFGGADLPEPAVKECTACGQTKALEDFSPKKGGRLGRAAQCKPCRAARNAERRQDPAVREEERQYFRRYRAQRRSDPEYKAKERAQQRQYNQTPERKAAQRLYAHRRRALLYSAETDGHTFDQLLDYWVDELGVTGCADCMRPLDDGFEIDHIVPLARGGADTMENKLPLCPDCHGSKLDRDPYAFYADRYPSLAPWLTPFAGLIPRLSDDEVQALVDAYEARDEAV